MSWVEGHHTARALWVEGTGPSTPVWGQFRGAIEETLFEDCAPSAACHPPLVLCTAVGTITLHENCCHLGNQKERNNCSIFKTKDIMRWREKKDFRIMSNKYIETYACYFAFVCMWLFFQIKILI